MANIKKRFKVAIDAGPLSSGHAIRGIGFYSKELLNSLKDKRDSNISIDLVDLKSVNQSKYDLVHYTSFNPYLFSLPFRKKVKTLVTIHDLIPLVFPKHYAPGIKGNIRLLTQKILLKRVDGILTISETSKKDIKRFLRINPRKIFVVHLAPWEMFGKLADKKHLAVVKQKYNLPDKFVMFLGDVNYNKNLITLVKACKIAKTPLVVVGKHALDLEFYQTELPDIKGPRDWVRFLFNLPHPEEKHFKQLLDEFRISNVIRTGLVSDEDLVAIFNLATVYCQPSYYEGYGLPIVQAMACGLPVLASDISAHKEIAGDAVTYADPENVNDFAHKIKKLMNDPGLREKLVEKGLTKVKGYSWDKFISDSLEVYKKILERI
jgi:glycosyltransferase involved in cell wall biosynthesis